jgi:hypothetical protein
MDASQATRECHVGMSNLERAFGQDEQDEDLADPSLATEMAFTHW